jgi:hypothetical protein
MKSRPKDIIGSVRKLLAGCRLSHTLSNYLAYLSALLYIANSAYGMKLYPEEIRVALIVYKRLGVISKSAN